MGSQEGDVMLKNRHARLGYTAGIIDGEGCISIFRYTKHGKPNYSSYHRLIVSITSTDEWLCQWFKMQYGGSVQPHIPYAITQSKSWIWVVIGKRAAELLESILPYLQIKRPQAELAIKFQKGMRRRSKMGDMFKRLTEEELAVREAQRLLLKGMHSRKGVG